MGSGLDVLFIGDYKNASILLSQLAETYGDSKYMYWNRKCMVLLGDREPLRSPEDRKNLPDFYAYMTFLKSKQKPPVINRTYLKASLNSHVAERVDTLAEIGMKNEAAAERCLRQEKILLSAISFLSACILRNWAITSLERRFCQESLITRNSTNYITLLPSGLKLKRPRKLHL